ncbi:MAG TPA: hypothetical protein VNA19_03640 [Pyrinomonadaceae bacterium]|nr:hypothetical protein [Pyrinomonadaceae bacterium]
MDNSLEPVRWRAGIVAAFAVLLLAIYPQVSFWLTRGANWRGAEAQAHGDEVVYAAYVRALIDGRPRRNDPYTGRDDTREARQAESYFSIQFIPAYMVALPARMSGASTAQAFIALTCVAALASALAVFWLVALLTGDERVAASAVLVVLCCGSSYLLFEYLLGRGISNNHLSFMRRYLPSAPFPFLFIFCALAWRMLSSDGRRARFLNALAAGLTFALLVFSYFYLWTTAAAWLSCLALLWLALRRDERRRAVTLFTVVGLLALAALIPYFLLLSNRAGTTDDALLLTRTHAPDIFRLPEIIGGVVLLALAFGARRGLVSWRAPRVIFAASFALTPFVVFNQQIVTGRSLQPFHYQMFSANYLALLALVLAATLLRRGTRRTSQDTSQTVSHDTSQSMPQTILHSTPQSMLPSTSSSTPQSVLSGTSQSMSESTSRRISSRVLVVCALAAFCSGAAETFLASRRFMQGNIFRDEAIPAAARLAALARSTPEAGLDTRSVVFATHITIADNLPAVAPQPVLWSPHLFNFPGVTLEEDRERLLQHLFYAGVGFADVDAGRFDTLDNRRRWYLASLVRRARLNPNLTADWQPVTPAEVRAALQAHATYVAAFDRARAARPMLSYVLTSTFEQVDFSNLDRFYERDAGERVGEFTLYRVRLRP